jgi:hypothetical protein
MTEQRALLKDSDWRHLQGDACRVVGFTPMAEVKNGEVYALDSSMPYASVTFECRKSPQLVDGFICHRIDFINLTEAMKAKLLRVDTEVLMFWNKKQLRGYAKLFSKTMPRFCFMLCQKGAFELMTNNAHRPELRGEARFFAMAPIMEWIPEVMR